MSNLCQAITAIFLSVILSAPVAAAPRYITERYDDTNGLSSRLVGGGVQDADGLLWFATWNGLNCYDGYDFHWVNIRPGDGASIATDRIRDIMLSPGGDILCRTDDDIYEFSLSEYAFRDIPADKKDSIAPLMGQNWLGITDTQGNRWTADKKGLYKTYSRHHPARVIEGTAGKHPRTFMLGRDGRIWIGCRSDRTIRIIAPGDSAAAETVTLESAPYVLFQDSRGDVWAGCKPGALSKLGGDRISSDAVYDIKEDSRGRLWIATFGDGIKCCPNPGDDHPSLSPSIGGRKVRQLLITPGDNIVAATTEGLLVGHIDSDDHMKTSLRQILRDGDNANSLASNATMALARDSRGNIFIATESSGIDMIGEEALFSDNPAFAHFNRRNSSLTGDICKAMTLAADTLLMVVGSDNVMAFNPATGQTVNFGKTFWADTCRFAETTPLRLPDGSWLFGAEQGAFLATPHNLYSRGIIPPVVFTTIAVNGQGEEFRLPPARVLSLRADQRNATIRFAALDYTDNSGILYRTRVDGSPWTNAGRNRGVTLFNLSPGEHTLEVQSTDRYGRWVDNTRVLTITVAPYWHETWWATVLFCLLALALAAGALYLAAYIRRVNRQRRELLDKYIALMRGREPSGDETPEPEAYADNLPAAETEETSTEQTGEPKPEDTPLLRRVRRYIEENISNPDANVDDMALAAAASRSTLNRHLRSLLGVSAAQLLAEARMSRAEQLLAGRPDLTITDIASLCGYSDPQYFQRVFKAKRGVAASELRQRPETGR